jgi:hypothetical protein
MSFVECRIDAVKASLREDLFSYAASSLFHAVLFLTLALVLGTISPRPRLGDALSIVSFPHDEPPAEALIPTAVSDDRTELDDSAPDSITLTPALQSVGDPRSTTDRGDDAPEPNPGGGQADGQRSPLFGAAPPGAYGTGLGPMLPGISSVGPGWGTCHNPGTGGSGFGPRTLGPRRGGPIGSAIRRGDLAVASALDWLARHQGLDGGWSLDYRHRCKDPSCTGEGASPSEAAATAMGLLPFLAAGQTHQSRSHYQKTVKAALAWLVGHQKPTGDLSAGGSQMYSHGLATIALCEAYGMTGDRALRVPAQAALHFIEVGQDPETGGWWYAHLQRGGDTSVFGWQLMAMKSGLMAKLSVSPASLERARKWLDGVGKGTSKGLFSYRPDVPASNTMTSVGLLCTQYLGASRGDPRIIEGTAFLMANLPAIEARNVYYWYYAAQVMHNQPGPQWDQWYRRTRRILIESQATKGCAAGSWDPERPKDAWGDQGGRLMMTSLSALTLEVPYRFLPLYHDMEGGAALVDLSVAAVPSPEKAAATKGDKKPAEKK